MEERVIWIAVYVGFGAGIAVLAAGLATHAYGLAAIGLAILVASASAIGSEASR